MNKIKALLMHLKILGDSKETTVVATQDYSQVCDMNQIAESIEKVDKVLHNLKAQRKKNHNAIQTWQIVRARLRANWRNAMVEYNTHTHNYTFQ
jgi:hypothetical protein